MRACCVLMSAADHLVRAPVWKAREAKLEHAKKVVGQALAQDMRKLWKDRAVDKKKVVVTLPPASARCRAPRPPLAPRPGPLTHAAPQDTFKGENAQLSELKQVETLKERYDAIERALAQAPKLQMMQVLRARTQLCRVCAASFVVCVCVCVREREREREQFVRMRVCARACVRETVVECAGVCLCLHVCACLRFVCMCTCTCKCVYMLQVRVHAPRACACSVCNLCVHTNPRIYTGHVRGPSRGAARAGPPHRAGVPPVRVPRARRLPGR